MVLPSLPAQPGIFAPGPTHGRYLSFRLTPDSDPAAIKAALGRLSELVNGLDTLLGIGASTVARVGAKIEGLHDTPTFEGALEPIPGQPRALWLWLRGDDRGELLQRGFALSTAAEPAFALDAVTDGFRHGSGRDLTGYEDGTENPKGDDAREAALVASGGPGLEGSSFVAVQHWLHELTRFARFPSDERDAIIGRRRLDNSEIADAPESAHVKRTAQESFEPEAFMMRRSMPWIDGHTAGLEFVAFGSSFYAFEAQLRRMVGLEDGVVDGLFRFSRVLATSYYWCPPMQGQGQLDLRALGF